MGPLYCLDGVLNYTVSDCEVFVNTFLANIEGAMQYRAYTTLLHYQLKTAESP